MRRMASRNYSKSGIRLVSGARLRAPRASTSQNASKFAHQATVTTGKHGVATGGSLVGSGRAASKCPDRPRNDRRTMPFTSNDERPAVVDPAASAESCDEERGIARGLSGRPLHP
jgi:hypothetical protein